MVEKLLCKLGQQELFSKDKFEELMNKFDKNQDEYLDKKEIVDMVDQLTFDYWKVLRIEPIKQVIEPFWSKIDSENLGYITIGQFLDITEEILDTLG